MNHLLKGQCHDIFCCWFFYESVSPQPQSIPLGTLRIFSKIRGDIRKSRCTTGITDTVDKFATGVNDTGGQFLPPVLLVLLTPVANLELRISPRIFEKIRNGPNGILRGLGETDSEVENLVTLSL
jgi:hypothetical protein